STPGLSWTGTASEMNLTATTPWGGIDARFKRKGHIFNYSGNGLIGLLNDSNYEYAFPSMRTSGTLTAEGKTQHVSGTSWFDRQWGALPLGNPGMRWTWMNIKLSNGHRLAIWDIRDDASQSSWVTVQRPNGSYVLAAVKPLAHGAGRFWTSPATQNVYPT